MSPYKHLLLVALMSFFTASASAAVVFGDDVKFTYDDSTLYGTAMTVGNSIFFLPTNFRAESNNGEGVVPLSETLNITVEVLTPNYTITDFALAEAGDYFLDGAGASVTASGRLQLTSGTTSCGIFPCTTESTFNVAGLTVQNATTNWSSGTSIDLSSVGGWGSDSVVYAQIQNNLSATTLNEGVGEQAWIQKKQQLVGLEVTVIPLPAAVWLLLSALGVTGLFGRRSRV